MGDVGDAAVVTSDRLPASAKSMRPTVTLMVCEAFAAKVTLDRQRRRQGRRSSQIEIERIATVPVLVTVI